MAILVLALCAAPRVHAQGTDPGKVDESFGLPNPGAESSVHALALQPDGKVLVGGTFTTMNGVSRNRIARLNSDGSLDTGFNPGTGANSYVLALALQSDGKVLVGGGFTTMNGVSRNYIARLNSDGSLDTGFNPGTGTNGVVYALALQSDGKVVVGGLFSTMNGVSRSCIARLNSDGSLDTGFNPGTGANGQVGALALQPDGKVLVGGYFTTMNGVSRNFIARLNSDGSLDTGFNPGTGANDGVSALALQPDGKVLVGGYFSTMNGVSRNCIARLNSNGSLDTGFNSGTGANDGVSALALQSDGKVLVGGFFTTMNGVSRSCIARLNSDGSLDTGFNPGTGANNWVLALALQSDGKVLVGGSFTTMNGVSRNFIARLNSDGSLDTGFNPGTGASSMVWALALQSDGKVLVGGFFTTMNGVSRNYIARLNNDPTDTDGDGTPDTMDACPNDATKIAKVTYYLDADADGFGLASSTQLACSQPSGYVGNSTDCDDTRAGVNPAATEICDAANRDEDCDSVADNADSSAADGGKTDFYTDSDNDNYGVGTAQRFCDEPALFAAVAGDCNDSNAAGHPTAVENCANIAVDNDCDGVTTAAEAVDSTTYYVDADSDGHSINTTAKFCASTAPTGYLASLSSPVDCNDTRASVYPGGTEVCDGLDNDCADGVDNGLAFANYYGDSDADGAGDPAVVQNACAQPTGYVSNSNDQCPGNGALVNEVTYYRDADSDGFGSSSVTQQSCASTPGSGYVTNNSDCNDGQLLYADTDSDGFGSGAPIACGVANSTDGCPTNGNKQAPGVCGCDAADTDANSSGTADCADVSLAMSALSTHIGPSGTLTVRVSMGASAIYPISGAGLSVAFDATKLQFVSATSVAGGPFSVGTVVSSDNTAGTLRYTLALGSGQSATQSAANLVDIAFSPVAGAEACGVTGLVSFGTVNSATTSLSYSVGGSQNPVVSNLGAIYLDQTAPAITNAFVNASLAADAGTTAGAAVNAPTVTAFDACANEARSVSLSIALASGGTVTSWPARFPVGVSTITWSSTDQAGNTAQVQRTVTVANHQLLDLDVEFMGVMHGTSTRQIRVTAGSQVTVHPVTLTGNSGTISSVQVPVAASYPCVSVKCPSHSITTSAGATVSGARYALSVLLEQGDNNDDDMIEIFDYAIFVSLRGAGRAVNAVSNYNADTIVGGADFSHIALCFFHAGEPCNPAVIPPQPRDRISVKELRRLGRGDLAFADLNRDGWVDIRDMQRYVQLEGPALSVE
jgi:uncharacterized delta-60 repeat protein